MLLIYPGGMPAALERLAKATAQGMNVLGASSEPGDPASTHYGQWAFLPRYDAPDFKATLQDLRTRYGIDEIYCPHAMVWRYLKQIAPDALAGMTLENGEPYAEDLASYHALFRRVAAMHRHPASLASPTTPAVALSKAERHGLLRLASLVPGMCSEQKIFALADVARCCPPGDIVELGSWWGKSAVVLGWLSRRYAIGKLLCIDPWSHDEVRQGLADLDSLSVSFDMEETIEVFRTNLAMLAGDANYLRLAARDAATFYGSQRAVTSEAFGRTVYEGRIALLHIDANHQLDHVREDVRLWTPLVMPGGWVVLDDYLWPFGDGPRVVGDELLEAWGEQAATSFVAGTALFVQRRPD